MLVKVLLSVMLVLNLVGCATQRGNMANLQAQQLQVRISELEREVQQKDEEIRDLEVKLEKAQRLKFTKDTLSKKPDTSKITPKQIQTALTNAGFYSGPIDGKIGERTKKAIKEFQKANGLSGDGIVGKQTWLKLKKYLD